jgi:hypothetical protein
MQFIPVKRSVLCVFAIALQDHSMVAQGVGRSETLIISIPGQNGGRGLAPLSLLFCLLKVQVGTLNSQISVSNLYHSRRDTVNKGKIIC